ncbi:MAG TPA: lipid A-modifier LpxR family protein, partial [Chitinophagaceae bacterium]|nr:lipid A-modifier LpxR family protein [Chitinophagaceae bacterium]
MPFKYITALSILFCCTRLQVLPQQAHLFRLYEDNDFLNIAGRGTDKGYTNGTRLDYFYQKTHPSRFFLDKWFPAAGAGSVNTFSYSLMQVMLVPNDISTPLPDKNDWPYSGALVASHGLYS